MATSSSRSIFYLPITTIISLSLLLLIPLAIAAESENQYKIDGKVLNLDESNFDAAISNFDYVFVDFYAPWCGHCKHLSPELDKAAPMLAALKQPIVIAKVDADKYRKLASKHNVDGYPTLKIFMHGVATEYYGPRKADKLVKALSKFVAPDVTVLDSDSGIKNFVEEAGTGHPIFIGFGLNESLIASLAAKYKKKGWFSVAKDFSDDMMNLYDFDKVPALAAVHPVYNEQSVFYGPFEDSFIEDYIKQSLLPLVLPISQESLKSLKDEQRKVVVSIVKDETDDQTKGLIKVLKAAASANRDLIFAYVGTKQWGEFTESFEVDKKTKLPKMIVWDRDEGYSIVNGSESIDEADMGTEVSRFLGGYREGRVIEKRITGLTLMGFIKSNIGVQILFVFLFVVIVLVLILAITTKEEPLTVGTREQADDSTSSAPLPESSDPLKQD